MAWVSPSNISTGDVLAASRWNQDVVENTTQLYTSVRRFAYQQRTSTYSASASVLGSAADIFSTDLTWTAAGSTAYRIEWWFPYFDVGTATVPRIHLVDGSGGDLGWLSVTTTGITTIPQGVTWYTPSAGSTSVNLRMTNGGSGTGTLGMGAGGSGAYMPGWMAVYGPGLT
jgi:hypothetical protein